MSAILKQGFPSVFFCEKNEYVRIQFATPLENFRNAYFGPRLRFLFSLHSYSPSFLFPFILTLLHLFLFSFILILLHSFLFSFILTLLILILLHSFLFESGCALH